MWTGNKSWTIIIICKLTCKELRVLRGLFLVQDAYLSHRTWSPVNRERIISLQLWMRSNFSFKISAEIRSTFSTEFLRRNSCEQNLNWKRNKTLKNRLIWKPRLVKYRLSLDFQFFKQRSQPNRIHLTDLNHKFGRKILLDRKVSSRRKHQGKWQKKRWQN